jgi:hypothetical protein
MDYETKAKVLPVIHAFTHSRKVEHPGLFISDVPARGRLAHGSRISVPTPPLKIIDFLKSHYSCIHLNRENP